MQCEEGAGFQVASTCGVHTQAFYFTGAREGDGVAALACNGGDAYGRCGAGGFVGNGAQGNPPALRVFDDDAGVGGLNGQAERFAVGVLKAVGAAALHVEWGFHAAAVVKVQGADGRGLGSSADAEQHGKSNEFHRDGVHRDGFHRDVLSGWLGKAACIWKTGCRLLLCACRRPDSVSGLRGLVRLFSSQIQENFEEMLAGFAGESVFIISNRAGQLYFSSAFRHILIRNIETVFRHIKRPPPVAV